MKAMLIDYLDRIRSSFWFVPSVMAGAAAVLSYATVALDETVAGPWLSALGWAYTGGAEGASQVLGTVAGSMITIAGVVFSMTLVALSLASSQLGPRLLRNFMRDAANQVVLGTFVATFVYCLLILRTIRRAEEVAFVPHLSVTVGLLFGLASMGVLIYFIHHVSVSIQADVVVARVGKELVEGIDRLYPETSGSAGPPSPFSPPEAAVPKAFDQEARPAGASADGYVQYIAADALMELASRENLLLRLERRPGQYVVQGSPLVMAWPGDRVTGAVVDAVNSAFTVGIQRTATQDIEFAVHQLVEIAARALSPGINDPFTAIACVDRLGSALCRLAGRELPSANHHDGQGLLRVIASPVTFPQVLDAAFNQIRQYARTSASVTIRLLETILVIAESAQRPEDRAALRCHAEMIANGARTGLPEVEDRRAVEAHFRAARRALREPGEIRG